MGGHHLPQEGKNKIWLTPPQVLHALGEFDLDPCAVEEPRPWATAKKMIAPPADGLTMAWRGRVFCNPPYSLELGEWLERCAIHCNAIALIFARTETAAWNTWVWPFADSILFLRGRLTFRLPDGSRAPGNAGAPSVLISYDRPNTKALERSGLRGTLVRPTSTKLIEGSKETQLSLAEVPA